MGRPLVSWFMVVDGDRVTLVDAGLPGYWRQLDEGLEAMGRSRDDVEALVLTHGDNDHVGFGEKLRTETGARVFVHEADVELATTHKQKDREAGMLPELRRPAALKLIAEFTRYGGARVPPVREVETYADGEVLDVPGRPTVVHAPGHTPGHCVVTFPERGVVMVGDALCTRHPTRGTVGPALMPRCLTTNTEQALASLDRIAALDAGIVLPGHGEPWTEGTAGAVERVRAAGVT
jgi:glyoxylase-like metal-dependent hydrolase (beta-lactamase superfamily II)